jgi:trans-2,3-dihydro-3-hydroxyanthranilate isomerase
MRHHYYTLDVFTGHVFGGNPLAVFPDASSLRTEWMPLIARELNLSETVFVLPPENGGTCRLRIFTPGSELAFAGHPTVGTAILLATLGRVPLGDGETRIVFEEGVGSVPVTIRGREGRAEFAQLAAAKLPEYGPPPPAREVLAGILSLDPVDIVEADVRTVMASCGVPFLFVPLANRDAVKRARLDTAQWQVGLAGAWASKIYLYARDPELSGSDLRARMFAPSIGIAEDPATGGAAAPLAGYLASRLADTDGTFRWTIEQGFEMGRPSLLHAEADKRDGQVTSVRVGGSAVLVAEGWMDLTPTG